MVIYIKNVQCGVNYNNKQVYHSAKVQGYAKAVNNFSNLDASVHPTICPTRTT